MKAAMRAIDRGARVYVVANYYAIPRTSLRGYVHSKNLSRKRGSNIVLTTIEEEELIKYLFNMANRGFPLT